MTRASLVGLVGLVLLTSACGSKKFDSLCANQVPPPAACNTPCDPAPGAPSACESGYHCSPDGKCDTFCTPGGGQCGEGYECTSDGFCVSDGNGSDDPIIDAADCPAVHVTATKKIPTVQLLLDQSGSMTAAYGGGLNRWEALRKSLVDPTNGVVKKLEGQVVFGATLYSGRDPAGTVCPELTSKPRALNNFTAIQQLLQANPITNTPTAASIDAVVRDFAANPPAAGSVPIILLATDGLPDTCDVKNPGNQQEQDAANLTSIQAAQRAYAAGIKLFFLFIGDDSAGDHPQKMANAGAGMDVNTGNAKFYVATNPNALTAAFNDIVGGVVSCDLKLTGQVSAGDAPMGTVTINNGTPLKYGDDWNLDADGLTLHILGGACTTLKNTTNAKVDAVFPCGTIIL
jgi:hypothetical protein